MFAAGDSGKSVSMSEQNRNANQKTTTARSAASRTREAADKATAPAGRAADNAAGKAGDAASATASGAERAAQSAAKGVEAGRRAVVATSGQVAAGAKTAWTVIANRRMVAAGAAAGLTALTAASYAVGRRAERHTHGPLTRMTGGRI